MRLPAVLASRFSERTQRDLERAAVVLLVILASVAVGVVLGLRRTGMLRAEMVIGGVLAVSCLPVWLWLRRLEYGILAILLAAGLLNAFTLPTGTQSRLVLSLVISAVCIALWLFKTLFMPRGARLKPSRVNAPLLTFIAIGFVSYAWSLLMRDPTVYMWSSFPLVQIAALAVNTLLPLLALFVANQIEDRRWLVAITWGILGLGAFAVVSRLFHLPTVVAISNGSRGLFPTWVGVLAYTQMLFNHDLKAGQRIMLGALFLGVVYLYFVVHVTWFSGWVPLAIACAAATLMHSRRLSAFLAAVLGIYLFINARFYFADLYQIKVAGGSLERLDIWEQSLSLVARHPLLGMGPAGYAVYNVSYFPGDARSTHNNYFDILAQTGIIGFAVFLWLIGSFLVTAAATRRQLLDRPGFEQAFANGVLAGLCGVVVSMMLGDWVLPFAYNQTISGFDNAAFTWILLGAMVSLHQQVVGHGQGPDVEQTPGMGRQARWRGEASVGISRATSSLSEDKGRHQRLRPRE